MKTGFAWALAIAAAGILIGFAGPATGTLIFIDDFNNTSINNATPAPGEGGGIIGGNGFWTFHRDTTGVTGSVASGLLQLSGNATLDWQGCRIYSARHAEFKFLESPLLLIVEGIEMDWTGGYGLFEIGFTSGNNPIFHNNSNAVSFVCYADGSLRHRIRERGTNLASWSSIPGLTSDQIKGFELFLDDTYYGIHVTYRDDTSSGWIFKTHGLNSSYWDHDVSLNITLRASGGDTNVDFFGHIDTVRVIPEPGALSLALVPLGLAWLIRRHRRRTPA